MNLKPQRIESSLKLPFETVLETMEELDQMVLEDVDPDLIRSKLLVILEGAPVLTAIVAVGKIFERAVKGEPKPEFVSQISFPPVVQQGNLRGKIKEPVFYCANDVLTALRETNSVIGHRIVVGRWRNDNLLSINPIGIEYDKMPELINPASNWYSEWLEENKKVYEDRDFKILDYVGKLFLRPRGNSNDELIRQIANIFYGYEQVTGIAYPSIKNNLTGINYAIKSSFVQSGHLVLDHAILIEITNVDEIVEYDILDFSEGHDEMGKLNWVDLDKRYISNSNDDIFFANTDDKWKLYDQNQELLLSRD
jgi:hypothetical protein